MFFFILILNFKIIFSQFTYQEMFSVNKIKNYVNNKNCYMDPRHFVACFFLINDLLLIESNGSISLLPRNFREGLISSSDFNSDFILSKNFVSSKPEFDKLILGLELIFDNYKNNLKLVKKGKLEYSDDKEIYPLNFSGFLSDHLSNNAFLNKTDANTVFSLFSFQDFRVINELKISDLFSAQYKEIETKLLLSIRIINTYLYILNPKNYLSFKEAIKEISVYKPGFEVSFDKNYKMLKITKILKDSDAEQLITCTYISEINGCSDLDKYYFDNYISSFEEGKTVHVHTSPDNQEFDIKLDRIVKIPSINYNLIDNELGQIIYIKVNHFLGEDFYDNIFKIRTILSENKPKGVVIDLRNNPGGSVNYAKYFISLFYEDNSNLISIDTHTEESYLPDLGLSYEIYDGPLAILQNAGTASAAELVTATLKSVKRKKELIVVGESKQSFGKAFATNEKKEFFIFSTNNISNEKVPTPDPNFHQNLLDKEYTSEANKHTYLYLNFVEGVLEIKGKTYNYKGIEPDYYVEPINNCVNFKRMVEYDYYYSDLSKCRRKTIKPIKNDGFVDDYPLKFTLFLLDKKIK